MRTLRLALAIVCTYVCAFAMAGATDGVTDREIRIGMSNALSGPAAALGLQLRAGANAYLNKVNATGGVHGRQIALISVDDSYDPLKAAQMTHELIERDKVFALFGYVGTPTSAAVVPIVEKDGVPYLFPFTGAEFLRNPVKPLVFNLRASYFDETEALVAHLTRDGAAKRIALFIQDDEFGEAGKAGAVRALAKRNLKPVMEARYTRNTVDIDAGLLQLQQHKPDAVIFIGTYRPLAQLARRTRIGGPPTRYATVSFIGTSELIKHAGADGDGIIISQVMPSPDDASDALVRQYQADVAPGARNYGSLEGYADAMLLVEALKRCGKAPTRATLLKTLEQIKTDIGAMPIVFSAQSHQGSDRVYLTVLKAGKVVPLSK